MFHSRKLSNWINHIHKRALRLIYKNYSSSFDELLLRDHHSNLQKLAIEIFKVKLGLPPKIMKNVFPRMKNTYDLRKKNKLNQEM